MKNSQNMLALSCAKLEQVKLPTLALDDKALVVFVYQALLDTGSVRK